MPSKKANKYGTRCEYAAAERYDLELARCSWHDGIRQGSIPVEIKATRRRHADGQPGNFKLYHKYHRKLRRNNGEYVFVLYRKRGKGTEVLKMTNSHSSSLPRLNWHGGGDHRSTKQAKLSIEEVF